MTRTFGLGLASLLLTSSALAQEIKPMNVAFTDWTVETSLTGVAGDPAVGRYVFANRKQGNCLACHMNADLSEERFHGEVGPNGRCCGSLDRSRAARDLDKLKDDVRRNNHARLLRRQRV